jgi:hypothetical protein
MVKVYFDALGRRQTTQILVVSIVLEKGYPVRTNALQDGLGDSGLTRT